MTINLRGYAAMISKATGIINPAELAEIEDYMRHDIFHSTLDWQPASIFDKAAIIAAETLGHTKPHPKLA